MAETKKRNGEIDVLRFLFAIGICLFHWYCNYPIGPFRFANIGVEFFFVLSGYLLAKQVEKYSNTRMTSGEIADSTWKMLLRKIKGFYPYYICAFFFSLVFQYIITGHYTLKQILTHLLRIIPTLSLSFQALNHNSMSFGVASTWYLSALVIGLLILYPILLKNYFLGSRIICPLLFLFITGYCYTATNSLGNFDTWTGLTYGGILKSIAELSLGVFMAEAAKAFQPRFAEIEASKWKKLLATVVKLFLYGIAFLCAYGYDFGGGFNLHTMLFFAIGIVLSFNGVGYTIPDHPITRYLGKASLGIYIFHGFVRWSVKRVWDDIGNSLVTFYALALMSIVIALILMYVTDLVMKAVSKRKNAVG